VSYKSGHAHVDTPQAPRLTRSRGGIGNPPYTHAPPPASYNTITPNKRPLLPTHLLPRCN
jgi:hypothetical protein